MTSQEKRYRRQRKAAQLRIRALKAAYTRAIKIDIKGTAAALTRHLPGVIAMADGEMLADPEWKVKRFWRDWYNLGVDTFNRGLRLRRVVRDHLRKLAAQGDPAAQKAVEHYWQVSDWKTTPPIGFGDTERKRHRRCVPKARGRAHFVVQPAQRGKLIPLAEALQWTPTSDEFDRWERCTLHHKAMEKTNFLSRAYAVLDSENRDAGRFPLLTYAECLLRYCCSRWGRDRGSDICADVVLYVQIVAARDLRKRDYRLDGGLRYDKRKKLQPKPRFTHQEHYWAWLVKLTKQRHNTLRSDEAEQKTEPLTVELLETKWFR